MALSCLESLFIKELLPTLGLPASATFRPERTQDPLLAFSISSFSSFLIEIISFLTCFSSKFEDQNAALKLAICDDIGQAAYDTEQVAINFMKLLETLEKTQEAGIKAMCLQNRYGIFVNETIKDKSLWLLSAAERHTSGDTRRMSQRLLDDFRKNLLGNISLELP